MNQGSFQKGYLRINAYEYKKKENLKVLLFREFKMKENWKTEENLNWEMKNIPQREKLAPLEAKVGCGNRETHKGKQ